MRSLRHLIWTLALAAPLFVAVPASACPNCKEAAASAIDEGDDPYREALAYNRSIYVMLSMPYALVGFGGIYVYRHLRRPESPRV